MIDLDEIERLAESALAVDPLRNDNDEMWRRERALAEKCDPATILALVARLRAAEAVLEVMPGVLGLLRKAQDVLTQYLIPDGNDADTALDALLALLDGPEQRAAQNPARAALAAYRALTEEPTP
ncbi:MAG: hypothetical protein ACYC3L_00690 [Gemmatimonadaceae bacterium]